MRVPKRVKIVANNDAEEYDYYSQFVGNEYDVEFGSEYDVVLRIPSADGKIEITNWYMSEYEVLEWEEVEE